MNFLLLIAHGSRRQNANEEIVQLAEHIAGLAQNDFDGVEAAFLEIADPGIRDGIARCVERGATRIVVVPYFLASGTHVQKDIPEEIDRGRCEYGQVTIELARYLGASATMAQLVLDCSRQIE